MNNILFLIFLISTAASAQVGIICPESKEEIIKKKLAHYETIMIKNYITGSETINPRINIPDGSSIEDYQERYGLYYFLMSEAQVQFPYMPELILLYHINASTKQYRKGFKAFEGEGEAVELNSMYCNALTKAIKDF